MPARLFTIEGIGEVIVSKRRGARAVRLSLAHNGTIKLSLPPWMPYAVGLEFVKQKKQWIIDNKATPILLKDGQRIGKAHTLRFVRSASSRLSSRVANSIITVSLPGDMSINVPSAQAAAEKACVRALKNEANALLPQRLEHLAKKHGFDYKSLQIKQLKSRWGSCNHKKEIVLNCFLMQLPWQLIDYVILHELTHTRILAHGKPFWSELGKHVDDLPSIRRIMRSQQPYLKAE